MLVIFLPVCGQNPYGPISHSSFSHGQKTQHFCCKYIHPKGSTGEIHESWLKSIEIPNFPGQFVNFFWNPLKSRIFHWNPKFSRSICEKKPMIFGCFSPPFSNRRKAAEKALPVPWRCQFPSWIQKLDPFEIRSSMFIGNPYIWVWVKTLVPSEPQNSW